MVPRLGIYQMGFGQMFFQCRQIGQGQKKIILAAYGSVTEDSDQIARLLINPEPKQNPLNYLS